MTMYDVVMQFVFGDSRSVALLGWHIALFLTFICGLYGHMPWDRHVAGCNGTLNGQLRSRRVIEGPPAGARPDINTPTITSTSGSPNNG